MQEVDARSMLAEWEEKEGRGDLGHEADGDWVNLIAFPFLSALLYRGSRRWLHSLLGLLRQ